MRSKELKNWKFNIKKRMLFAKNCGNMMKHSRILNFSVHIKIEEGDQARNRKQKLRKEFLQWKDLNGSNSYLAENLYFLTVKQ